MFNSILASAKPASGGAPASAIVSGAGTAEANGTYTNRGQFNGKDYYNLVGQPDSTSASAIFWDNSQWNMKAANGEDRYYFSNDDVAFPWLATTWEIDGGNGPASDVTEG